LLNVLGSFYFVHPRGEVAMDAGKERKLIRLWNLLRRLEREGRPTALVRRQIEQALAERERDAA
jgi:hypothetical protein